MIDRVTITGADDSVSQSDLFSLSVEYPFVEWGILVSESRTGTGVPRYPSPQWIRNLQVMKKGKDVRLSLHICGHWSRSMLRGHIAFPTWMMEGFLRIQLNFSAEKTFCDPHKFAEALRCLGDRQVIFQLRNGNEHLRSVLAINSKIDAAGLFDASGGSGRLPDQWPSLEASRKEINLSYYGYAGGLGPYNLDAQLPRIATAAGCNPIWVDMESGVRLADGIVDRLDLAKVRRCLQICEEFMKSRRDQQQYENERMRGLLAAVWAWSKTSGRGQLPISLSTEIDKYRPGRQGADRCAHNERTDHGEATNEAS